jgi:hypothetical protein
MRHLLMLTAALALVTGYSTTASAQKIDKNGRCHAANGQFAKAEVCGGVSKSAAKTAAAGPPPVVAAPPAMAAKGRCKNDKGKFAKCGSPGAHPA